MKPVLALPQPLAMLVCTGYHASILRDQRTCYRGEVLIYALPPSPFVSGIPIQEWLWLHRHGLPEDTHQLPTGVIVGTADLDHVEDGRWHFWPGQLAAAPCERPGKKTWWEI